MTGVAGAAVVPHGTPPLVAPDPVSSSLSSTFGPITATSKRECVYSAGNVEQLPVFESLVGADVSCAMVFNDAAPDWGGWDDPWFLDKIPHEAWGEWVRAEPGRTLVITQNMFPSDVDTQNWRVLGALGAYDGYAKTLAENLVAAGLGSSVIRLGHEANGTWYPDNIGTTPEDYALWVQFWRNIVTSMRSVPGANFLFDWCVNAGTRNIPLSDYYPGNNYVNIIGVDAYDTLTAKGVGNRWQQLYNEPGGLGTVVAFAQAHDKPLSIPEWGVASTSVSGMGGDDPAYVDGIAGVVRDDEVAYQSYFDQSSWADGLTAFPNSLSAYRSAFGDIYAAAYAAFSLAGLSPGQDVPAGALTPEADLLLTTGLQASAPTWMVEIIERFVDAVSAPLTPAGLRGLGGILYGLSRQAPASLAATAFWDAIQVAKSGNLKTTATATLPSQPLLTPYLQIEHVSHARGFLRVQLRCISPVDTPCISTIAVADRHTLERESVSEPVGTITIKFALNQLALRARAKRGSSVTLHLSARTGSLTSVSALRLRL